MKLNFIITLIVCFVFNYFDGFSQIEDQNSGTTNGLCSIHFVDQNYGWIVGMNGTILKTVDSGNNWESINLGNSYAYYDVFFLNQNLGWIVGCEGSFGNPVKGVIYK